MTIGLSLYVQLGMRCRPKEVQQKVTCIGEVPRYLSSFFSIMQSDFAFWASRSLLSDASTSGLILVNLDALTAPHLSTRSYTFTQVH
jgi:hypothetical protein